MNKDQWIAEHESACEDFASNLIDEAEFRARLIALGFDWYEIEEQISLGLEDKYSLEDHVDHGVYA